MWRIFALWVGVTVVILAMCLSDFFFGKGDAKRLGKRAALAFIWPLAALSSAGRDFLFNAGKDL
jgi:hypothetical protein